MGQRANFTELNTKDPVLQRMFNAISKSINSLARAVPQEFDGIRYFDAVFFQSTSSSTTKTATITHGLGRSPRGWFVVSLRQIGSDSLASPVFETQANFERTDRSRTLILTLDVAAASVGPSALAGVFIY